MVGSSSEPRKFPLDYRTIQKIKTEEFENFFDRFPEYQPYLNHLGEIHWMTEDEAARQHEFFPYTPSPWKRLVKWINVSRKISLAKLKAPERALRVQIRRYLEETYQGSLSPETEKWLQDAEKYPLSRENLEHVPITLDILENKSLSRWSAVMVLLLLVFGTASALLFIKTQPATGELLVNTNSEGARVFMDGKTLLGYSGQILSNIPAGEHVISVEKPGFVSRPGSLRVAVVQDSLVAVGFHLAPTTTKTGGFLKVTGAAPSSKIFVNNDYYGLLEDRPVISLNEGPYTITVQKEGYVTIPAEKGVIISPGDTTILSLEQIPLTARNRRPSGASSGALLGTLEVTSNISGARIFIDGRDTGKETDYVFSEISQGRHVISLKKKGYGVQPPSQEVFLSPQNPSAEASFTLNKEFEQVDIKTVPPTAEILIDNELRGRGAFSGLLKIGKHTLSFGPLAGYKAPNEMEIDLRPNEPFSLQVSYFPEIKIAAEVSDNGNIQLKNCELHLGYSFSNRQFTASEEAGPEVVYLEKLNNYFWKLGYAFPYKNPKGNDALQVTFHLPQDMDYQQKFVLRLRAAASREKYPLSLTTKTDILIKLNGTILSYYYTPAYLEDLAGMEDFEWDVTRAVKSGLNTLIIGTTDKNNSYYYIKRIEISN